MCAHWPTKGHVNGDGAMRTDTLVVLPEGVVQQWCASAHAHPLLWRLMGAVAVARRLPAGRPAKAVNDTTAVWWLGGHRDPLWRICGDS